MPSLDGIGGTSRLIDCAFGGRSVFNDNVSCSGGISSSDSEPGLGDMNVSAGGGCTGRAEREVRNKR